MANVWTHGVWTVRQGREEEFTALWNELAEEGMAQMHPVEPPTLLRDRDHPNQFISFGPWPDLAEVAAFRSSDAFRRAQERMQGLVEDFVTRTLDEVRHG